MGTIGFKKAECKDCYKCARICPVKAIQIKDQSVRFVAKDCIQCGQCIESCPQHAIKTISDVDRVKQYIKDDTYTIALISPAYFGICHSIEPKQLVEGLYRLGFDEVSDTTMGSAYVLNAYEELIERGEMNCILTSVCPAANTMIEKYYPDMIPYLAPVVSPVIAEGKCIRSSRKNVKVVSISSCLAESMDVRNDERTKGNVDCVIYFNELKQLFADEGINVAQVDGDSYKNFAMPCGPDAYVASGGIVQYLQTRPNGTGKYNHLVVDDVASYPELFECIRQGEISRCIIELNACIGGCVNGPVSGNSSKNRFKSQLFMQNIPAASQAGELALDLDLSKEFENQHEDEPQPTQEDILRILTTIGKETPEKELNCGACGYATCREKAIATFRNKSVSTMCIPYMYQRAKSLSDVYLSVTPSMVVMVDSHLKIIEFNRSAQKLLGITREQALEMYLDEMIDTTDFETVFETRRSIMDKRAELPKYGLVMMTNIIYVKEQNVVIAIFRDTTQAVKEKEKRYKVKMEAVDIAQQVIDRQMLVAQEIAGLLGETTAETKVTLTKLRESIMKDGDDI